MRLVSQVDSCHDNGPTGSLAGYFKFCKKDRGKLGKFRALAQSLLIFWMKKDR